MIMHRVGICWLALEFHHHLKMCHTATPIIGLSLSVQIHTHTRAHTDPHAYAHTHTALLIISITLQWKALFVYGRRRSGVACSEHGCISLPAGFSCMLAKGFYRDCIMFSSGLVLLLMVWISDDTITIQCLLSVIVMEKALQTDSPHLWLVRLN
jgi:hypothetical protein